MSIPKIIHQMWIGHKPAPQKEMETWKKFHPDWQYMLWEEGSLNEIFPDGLSNQQQYDQMPEIPGKCDIARYEILHKFGGFFVDADSICLRPIEEKFLESDSFSCYENETVRGDLIAVGYLATTKGNSLMEKLIEKIHQLNVSKKWWESKFSAWKKVGPVLLTETVKDLNYTELKIYPSYYFIPKHYKGAEYTGDFKPYCDHLWGSTPKSGFQYSEGFKD